MANTLLLNSFKERVSTGILMAISLVYYHGCVAFAANSGGRMGGRSFYTSSSSSSSYQNYFSDSDDSDDEDGGRSAEIFAMLILLGVLALLCHIFDCYPDQTSVLKIQVGLLGTSRLLQRDLNRIAETADTSKPERLKYILQETIIALMRLTDYCTYGNSWVILKRSIEEAEKQFNQLYIEERCKFDVETPVNLNNVIEPRLITQRSNDGRNEYIVITILVAVEDKYSLPPMNSKAGLKETLQKLATISSKEIKAVEVLWTPQSENETLTEREFLEDYSRLLRSYSTSPQV